MSHALQKLVKPQMFLPSAASCLISGALAMGITITEITNINTSTHMKMETRPVYLTNQSASLRPPMVPMTEKTEIHRPYRTMSSSLIMYTVTELMVENRTRYIPVEPATRGWTPMVSKAGL